MKQNLREQKLLKILENDVLTILDSFSNYLFELREELDFIEEEMEGEITEQNLTALYDFSNFLEDHVNVFYENVLNIDDVKTEHLYSGLIDSLNANLHFVKSFLSNQDLDFRFFKEINEGQDPQKTLSRLIPLQSGKNDASSFKANNSFVSLVYVYAYFMLETIRQSYRILRLLEKPINNNISEDMQSDIENFFVQANFLEYYVQNKIYPTNHAYDFTHLIMDSIIPNWIQTDMSVEAKKKELFEKYFQNIDEVTNKMLDQENQNKNSD
ncbi:type IV secretion system chaperone CagF [Helicobacter pylori]|uniref:type IV secretion system chaperone CagF n=1 Tax=Helicobacter pylori TaxID=210 RepID=UPI000574DD8E|nr:type IV secretion system chaperone CagF [Helicobacter pylori]KAA6513740.1 type IV secretion system chaperone CagF [Helicobacter pylori]KHL76571.1 sodium:calcium antiporter [Helicobacter pylori]MBH0303824.1 type IV secretion system chaperone CagF [Helicobacter pylori]MCQ2934588.1 type IV secretion system chaperone CagF [Helicobacter pylori]NHB18392.1 type IV secretion system chaperone CagF [Helicobacter pylori]